MVKKIIISTLLMSLLITPLSSVSAHPGRLDSKGGHNCSEASIAKGLCTGYHDHNGSSDTISKPAPSKSPESTPVQVQQPSVKKADIKVSFNHKPLAFNQDPVILNGRTLVELRTIFEVLGAAITWDAATKTVTATKGNDVVKLTVGQNVGYKNGQAIDIDTPATIVNGRTMIPARFVAEALGAKVDWDGNTKTVMITTLAVEANQPDIAGQNLEVHYINVGQGDATYIKAPHGEDILIDAGNNDKGDEVVHYLRKAGVDDIEIMIATHPDADHTGGLDTVLKEFAVESVYAPKVSHTSQTFEDFLAAVKNEGVAIKTVKAGGSLPIEDVTASFVAPVAEYGDNLNNWSAVLHLTYGNTSFLFTGDAELDSENDMMASGQTLKADVLKVGHHGSNTSTSEHFLNVVNPSYAVISAGKENRYGHPTQETLAKLVEKTIYRTDFHGTVVATSDGKNITFATER